MNLPEQSPLDAPEGEDPLPFPPLDGDVDYMDAIRRLILGDAMSQMTVRLEKLESELWQHTNTLEERIAAQFHIFNDHLAAQQNAISQLAAAKPAEVDSGPQISALQGQFVALQTEIRASEARTSGQIQAQARDFQQVLVAMREEWQNQAAPPTPEPIREPQPAPTPQPEPIQQPAPIPEPPAARVPEPQTAPPVQQSPVLEQPPAPSAATLSGLRPITANPLIAVPSPDPNQKLAS